MVGGDVGVQPRRLDLIEAGLTLPDAETLKPTARNRRAKIYPEVEHIVACCRQYGRFCSKNRGKFWDNFSLQEGLCQ